MATKSIIYKPSAAREITEQLVNDQPRILTDADFPVGAVAHQGDVILVRIAALPQSAKQRRNRQMAEGNTQGARHVLSKGRAFDCDPAEVVATIQAVCPHSDVQPQYIGPVFSTVNGVANLDHPEHGDYRVRDEMVIACVYQRSLDAEEREQRVHD